MARVALSEVIFTATVPASFAPGREVTVCARGTETPITIYSGETGPGTIAQPLVTDKAGRPEGSGGQIGWVEPGSYDLRISPEREGEAAQVLHWEATKGGVPGLSEAEVEAIAEEKGGAAITAAVAASGVGTAFYDSDAETWPARPTGFARVIFVSPVHGAPDPADAKDFDEKVEPVE